MTKKVTFDDSVQIIGISEAHIDHEREKEILTHFMKEQTIHNNPNKLFSKESESTKVYDIQQSTCLHFPHQNFVRKLHPSLHKIA